MESFQESVREALHRRPTLSEQVELTKAFSEGYGQIATRKDTAALKAAVDKYNYQL